MDDLWNKTDDYEWDDYFMHRFFPGLYQAVFGCKKYDDDALCNNNKIYIHNTLTGTSGTTGFSCVVEDHDFKSLNCKSCPVVE